MKQLKRIVLKLKLTDFPIKVIAFLTLLSGVMILSGELFLKFHHHQTHFLSTYLPFGFYKGKKIATLLFGFSLVYLSYNIYKRKLIAWWSAVFILVYVILTHFSHTKSSYPMAIAPFITLILLLYFKSYFIVKANVYNIAQGIKLALSSLFVAIIFGTAGFWFLNKKAFGIDFQLSQALIRTLREYVLLGNDDLMIRNAYADNFLDTIRMLGIISFLFAVYSIFKPLCKLEILDSEKKFAHMAVELYGNSSLDFFKTWSDKNYFFGKNDIGFVSFKISQGIAMALGEPVVAKNNLTLIIKEFDDYCNEHGLLPAFYCAPGDNLQIFEKLNYKSLKIGQEAIIDFKKFFTNTKQKKELMRIKNKFERDGFIVECHNPPNSKKLIGELRSISNEWLKFPGRRERNFSVGFFDDEYLINSILFTLKNKTGEIIAFANQIPSYAKNEATIDLMRYRNNTPNGTMDFLFLELFAYLHKKGFEKFDFGFSPIAIEAKSETDNRLKEKVLLEIYKKSGKIFSFSGLHKYKQKFDPVWNDRYLIYKKGSVNLLKTAVSVATLTGF